MIAGDLIAEHPLIPPDRELSDRSFDPSIGDFVPSVIEERCQLGILRDEVVHGVSDRARLRYFQDPSLHPLLFRFE